MEKKRSLKRKLCMAGIGVAARLSVPNRLHYWGAFPDKAPYIQIQIPETAVLTIAQLDQDAVLLRVEPMLADFQHRQATAKPLGELLYGITIYQGIAAAV